MRAARVLGPAIVLTLGLSVGVGQAAKSKQAKTEAEIEGQRFFPGGISEVFGDVHSKKSKCEKARRVTLVYTGTGSDPMLGTAITDSTGDWVLDSSGLGIPNGPYVVEVERKKVGHGDKKLTCKATTSPAHTFPEL